MLTVEESVIMEDKNTQADGKSRQVGWSTDSPIEVTKAMMIRSNQ